MRYQGPEQRAGKCRRRPTRHGKPSVSRSTVLQTTLWTAGGAAAKAPTPWVGRGVRSAAILTGQDGLPVNRSLLRVGALRVASATVAVMRESMPKSRQPDLYERRRASYMAFDTADNGRRRTASKYVCAGHRLAAGGVRDHQRSG